VVILRRHDRKRFARVQISRSGPGGTCTVGGNDCSSKKDAARRSDWRCARATAPRSAPPADRRLRRAAEQRRLTPAATLIGVVDATVEVMALMRQRRGTGAFLAVVGALAWSLAFAIWAYVGAAGTECVVSTGGVERCRSTPLAHGFGRELALVLVPSIVCLAVWMLLRRYCTRGRRVALGTAAVLAGLFGAFCYLAALSIGVLLFPTAALLAVAVATTPPPSAAPNPG
jgi:hypothetical protein